MTESRFAQAYEQFVETEGDRETIGGYIVHPMASAFPWPSEDDFEELAASIEEHGMQSPVMFRDGELIDGRSRLLAALSVGAQVCDAECDDALTNEEYIEINNLQRRNLSPSQTVLLKAMVRQKAGVDYTWKALAEEAGVSARTAQRASAIMRNGTDALQQAVIEGAITVTDAADITELDEPEQDAVAAAASFETDDFKRPDAPADDELAEAQRLAESIEKGNGKTELTEKADPVKEGVAKAQEQKAEKASSKPAIFNFGKWEAKMAVKLSKEIDKIPEDQRDRCKHAIGQMLSVSIRTVRDDDGDSEENLSFVERSSETVSGLVDELLEAMPASERKKSIAVLQDKFGEDDKPIQKAADAVQVVQKAISGLSVKEGAKVVKEIRDILPPPQKPTEYLPTLTDCHEEACTIVKKEMQQRCKDLEGFEGWETNGRRDHGRKMKKSIQASLVRFANYAGLGENAPKSDPVDIPAKLDTEDFREVWDEWLQLRKREKRSNSNSTLNRQLGILAEFTAENALSILQDAVEKSWKGIPAEFKKKGYGDIMPESYEEPAGYGAEQPGGYKMGPDGKLIPKTQEELLNS